MVLDQYSYIRMEQTDFPGSVGDSCAETSRYITLCILIGVNPGINLNAFVTEYGILRHPDSPWKENDTSSDQICPLIAAASLTDPKLADKIIQLIRQNQYKTGNGDLISPLVANNMLRHEKSKFVLFSDFDILVQSLLFKFPYRYNENTKKFDKSSNSADYLNFVNCLAFAKIRESQSPALWLAKKLTSPKTVLNKINEYYAPESNKSWVMNIYEQGIHILWSSKGINHVVHS